MKDFLNETQVESVVHVNKEILKCITLLQHKALEQGIQIQYIEFDQVHTQIQPLHIYQIIINLLSNAIEASLTTQNKKIILILKKEKDSFCIECKDFGTGIAPETLTKIGTYNFSTKSPSRGFGLYSLQHIVTYILNGTVTIQSEPDMGSLFSCKLPLRK
jgi:sensor histidine kinase regulating citrate/malate metabolism